MNRSLTSCKPCPINAPSHLFCLKAVEPSGGFVTEQKVGVPKELASNAQALFLASGQPPNLRIAYNCVGRLREAQLLDEARDGLLESLL